MNESPLVSCLMPTWNRREFILASVECFLRQTYEPRELLVVDDGDPVGDILPADPRIRYIRLGKRMTTGAKRNHCCKLAAGSILCHFDDDDWSDDGRVELQVHTILESGRAVTGFGILYFWDTVAQRAKVYRPQTPEYVCGTSLCFQKSYWQMHPFPPKQMASDNDFVYPAARNHQVAQSLETQHMVARLHGHHTSPKYNVREFVEKELLPAGFWENEKLRRGE